MATRTLTDLEQRILAFEHRWPGMSDPKKAAARVEFGWSFTAYTQRLHALLDLPAAAEADALLVHRLRRLREERANARRDRGFVRAV